MDIDKVEEAKVEGAAEPMDIDPVPVLTSPQGASAEVKPADAEVTASEIVDMEEEDSELAKALKMSIELENLPSPQ